MKRTSKKLVCHVCGKGVRVHIDEETEDWSKLNTATICPACSRNVYQKCTGFLAPWSWSSPSDRPFKPTTFSASLEKIAFFKDIGTDAIDRLMHCAREGNQVAAKALLEIAIHAVQRLQLMSIHYSRLFQPMARQSLVWPAMYSCRKSFNAAIAEPMIKRLELGKDAPGRGKSSPTSRSSRVVQCLFFWLYLNQAALSLPGLTRKTTRLWFEVGWRRLLQEAGEGAHKIDILARLGGSAANRDSTRRGMPILTEGMRRDDILAKAKEVVWKAFRNQVSLPSRPK